MSLLGKVARRGADESLATHRGAPLTAPRHLAEQVVGSAPPTAALPPLTACSPPCAAEIYERVDGACAPWHGFSSDEMLEAHKRAITLTLVALRNAPPRYARGSARLTVVWGHA